MEEWGKFTLGLIFLKPVKNTCKSERIASLSICLCFFVENGGREGKNTGGEWCIIWADQFLADTKNLNIPSKLNREAKTLTLLNSAKS